MTIREVIGNVKSWIKGKLIHDTILDEYFEWWCDDRGFLDGDEDELYEYIGELSEYLISMFDMEFNPKTGTPLALGFQQDYEEMSERIEDEGDNESYQEMCKMLARSLSNPFANEYDYMWMPIVDAVHAIIGQDASKLRDVEGTVGQKIALGFLMQGSDGPLAWAYVHYAR